MLHQKHNTKYSSSGGTTAPCPVSTELVAGPPAHSGGMTLIELLVVITILTTLVAGVIPLLSPNNEPRKLREAARELQSYITQTQAEAARTGRPHGIAFRESTVGSGVALEVYQLEVPQPFAGFSDQSRITVAASTFTYGTAGASPAGGTRFLDLYNGFALYALNFTLAAGGNDPFPPRFLSLGDEIVVDGRVFVVVDDNDDSSQPNQIDPIGGENQTSLDVQDRFVLPDLTASPTPTVCVWKNFKPGQILPPANALKQYQIIRQPSPSSELPLTLPRGIGIDMVASGIEGGTTSVNNFLIGKYNSPPSTIFNSSFYDDTLISPTQNTAGIMFAPSGRIESVVLNGNRTEQLSRVMLLLGRVENGAFADEDPNFEASANLSDDDVESRRETINWLNPDSRWLAIAGNNGRMVGADNRFFDPRLLSTAQNNDQTVLQIAEQLTEARQYAREMRREGGR